MTHLLQLNTSELQTIGSLPGGPGGGQTGDPRCTGSGEERDPGRTLQSVCGRLEQLQNRVQTLFERVDSLANSTRPGPERSEVCEVVCMCVHACSVCVCVFVHVCVRCVVCVVYMYRVCVRALKLLFDKFMWVGVRKWLINCCVF